MNYLHLLALVAGLMLPLQIAFNNKLTTFSGNPITSSLISFSVGTLFLLLYSISNPSAFQRSLQQVSQAPGYAWLGGLVGAFYIISTIAASHKIGMAMFLALVIGGQLITSLAIDHFGLLDATIKTFTWTKCIGLIMVLGGIILMKK